MMNSFKRLTLFLFLALFTLTAFSQSNLKKANKQYELYAFNTAIKSYLKILERQPNNPDALGRLADCYRNLNRMEEAEKWYEKAVKQKNVDELYYFQFGQVLKALGKYDQARSQFRKFSRNFPVQGKHYASSCDFALSHIGDNPNFEIRNEYLNSASSDFSPNFYGNQIVYSSSRRDIRNERNSSITLGNQPFISQPDANGYLESPNLLKKSFGGVAAEGHIAYSPDGKMVTFTKNNFVDGTRQIPSSGMELSLFFAEVTNEGNWRNEVPFPYNGTDYSTGFGSFAPDGNAVYFASDRPDGFGGYDIYVSYRVGNSWSAPENLGPAINTQGNEITPFHDGTFLFFASDWHIGFGGFDIFRASQQDSRWQTVEHAGTGLNSSRDDYGFTYNSTINRGYFVSNRVGGKGQEDLFGIGQSLTQGFVGLPGQINIAPNSGNSTTTTTNSTPSSGGIRTLALKILNSTDGQPVIGATVDLSTCGNGIQTTDNQGLVYLDRGRAYECSAIILATGYTNKTINVRSYINNKKGHVPVYMNREENVYIGQVTDRGSGYLLEGVMAEAQTAGIPQRYRARSGPDGKYALSLKSNKVYSIQFSKEGYRDMNITIQTGSPNESKLLEMVQLTAGASTQNNSPSTVFQQGNTNTNSGNYSDNNSSNVTYGYAVQVAAFSQNIAINLEEYRQKLSNLGETFIHNEKNKQKVRVGLFPTRDDAVSVQRRARAIGYNGAFIVSQESRTNISPRPNPVVEQPTPTPVPPPVTAPSTTDNANNGYTPPPAGSGNPINSINNVDGYVIQLAAFRDLNSFDKNTVIDIGVIDSYTKGDFTIFILSGYDTLEQANNALKKAKIRGYDTAFLVSK